MEVLHITRTHNLKSIMKYGILRNNPLLSIYDKVMEENYGKEYDKNKGLVFGFPEGLNKRDKYIKDFVYWKIWGDPRNIKIGNNDFNFKNIKFIIGNFSILLLDLEYEEIFEKYIHQQTNNMNNDRFWEDMDTRYEHDDKPLCLMNYDIPISKIKKFGIIDSYMARNKIEMRLKIK